MISGACAIISKLHARICDVKFASLQHVVKGGILQAKLPVCRSCRLSTCSRLGFNTDSNGFCARIYGNISNSVAVGMAYKNDDYYYLEQCCCKRTPGKHLPLNFTRFSHMPTCNLNMSPAPGTCKRTDSTAPGMWQGNYHHHHITHSSHSISAIGPAPHQGGKRREHCFRMFACIAHMPRLDKISSNTVTPSNIFQNCPKYHQIQNATP
ncbi:hypothetical protein COO60DRAFT_437532 [Scenedesmus sp. NREL 46B-D3]|nr:hypothetical protein COO60DRAFT_437532 [Scenedesmus sp. NREL 46B-D3]